MPLKEKNNMKLHSLIILFSFGILIACEPENKQLSDNEQKRLDSISIAGQRKRADSVRKTHPLMIVPPDSTYTGDYVDRYPNGVVKFQGQFRFGERHGQWMSFYNDGKPWSEMHYDKGLRHGPNNTYYENGKLRYTGRYVLDRQDSIWDYYDSLGNLAEKVLYKNDRVLKHLPVK
jgi:hypothetical protein